jgi:hypothetical protein
LLGWTDCLSSSVDMVSCYLVAFLGPFMPCLPSLNLIHYRFCLLLRPSFCMYHIFLPVCLFWIWNFCIPPSGGWSGLTISFCCYYSALISGGDLTCFFLLPVLFSCLHVLLPCRCIPLGVGKEA